MKHAGRTVRNHIAALAIAVAALLLIAATALFVGPSTYAVAQMDASGQEEGTCSSSTSCGKPVSEADLEDAGSSEAVRDALHGTHVAETAQGEADADWEAADCEARDSAQEDAASPDELKTSRYTVLVLDTSGSSTFSEASGEDIYTANSSIEYVKKAAKSFVESQIAARGKNYIAVVEFHGSSAYNVCEFTNSIADLESAIDGLSSSGHVRSIAKGLDCANALLSTIDGASASKNVVLCSTGMTNAGSYSYSGTYSSSTVGSSWYRTDTEVNLYAYANCAIEAAETLKQQATIYSLGIFQTYEGMPTAGKDIAAFFRLTAEDLATSSETFFDVDDPDKIFIEFENISSDMNDMEPFALGEDNNSFAHNHQEGGGFEGLSSYNTLSTEKYNMLISGASKSDIADVQAAKDKERGDDIGWCHGIAATMCLVYEGRIPASGISSISGTGDYFSLGKPISNRPKFLDAVVYWQLSQYLSSQDEERIARVEGGFFNRVIRWAGLDLSLSEFLIKLISHTVGSGEAIVFSFGHDDSGHSILALPSIQLENGTVLKSRFDAESNEWKIVIYDENGQYYGYLCISRDLTSFSFEDGNMNYHNRRDNTEDRITQDNFTYLEIRNAENLEAAGSWLGAGTLSLDEASQVELAACLDTADDVDADAEAEVAELENTQFIGLSLSSPFTVSNVEGETLTYDGSGLSGDMVVYDYSMAQTDSDTPSTIYLEVNASTFSVTYENGAPDVTLKDHADEYVSLTGSDVGQVTLSTAEGISFDACGGSFEARVLADDENDSVLTLSGSSAGSVSLTEEAGSVTVSADAGITGAKAGALVGVNKLSRDLGDTGSGFSFGLDTVNGKADGSVTLAGQDRYETSAKVALAAFPGGASGAIVTTGENFPDALSASSLAGTLGYPILLTAKDGLSDATAQAIEDLGATHFIVVGGENTVPASTYDALAQYGDVERVSGEDRQETAEAVYKRAVESGLESKVAIVTTGANYPDALSMSGYAYVHGAPIFLTDGNALTPQTQAALSQGGFDRVFVLGGTAAVPDSVEKWIAANVTQNVTRLNGADRYETSRMAAEVVLSEGGTVEGACIATGGNFPDALSGGALAGTCNTVMLLVQESSQTALSVLSEHAGQVGYLQFLGGESILPQSLHEAALRAAGIG